MNYMKFEIINFSNYHIHKITPVISYFKNKRSNYHKSITSVKKS